MSKVILRLWREQPGKFFCVSTKIPNVYKKGWTDHFFAREELDEVPQFIKDHSHLDLYFCPHGFNRRSRTVEESVPGRLLWADLDEVNPEMIPDRLRPTIALESSEGRFVGLWQLTDDDMTPELNKRLNMELCPDSHSSWIMTKALRMPGTRNRKYPTHQIVRLLWTTGPKYTTYQLDRLLPRHDDPKEEAKNARSVFRKYRKYIEVDLQREIFQGTPKEGKRSEMCWKIINAFAEAGADEDEIFEVISVSPWNKYKERPNWEYSLRKQIARAFQHQIAGGQDSSGERRTKPKKPPRTRTPQDEEDPNYDYDEDKKKLNIVNLAEAQEEEVEWIWDRRLPRGELVILEGDPGIGKSFLSQMISTHIVDGKRFPNERATGQKPTKGKVLYFDLENDVARVTKNRMRANRTKNMSSFFQVDTPLTIMDEEDIELVYQAMEDLKPDLVVFDTLNNYLGSADTHNSKEATQALTHFSVLARDFDCCVVVLRHLNKGNSQALYRGQGSISQVGVARVVLTVGHPKDEDMKDENWVCLAVNKNNLAAKARTLLYRIKSDDEFDKNAHIEWGEFVNWDADEVLTVERNERKKKDDTAEKDPGQNLRIAESLLLDFLKSGDVVRSSLIYQEAEKRSIPRTDLQKAIRSLGVRLAKGEMQLQTK